MAELRDTRFDSDSGERGTDPNDAIAAYQMWRNAWRPQYHGDRPMLEEAFRAGWEAARAPQKA